MITTILDVLGILLVIAGVGIWVTTWAPLWVAFMVAGALVVLFSVALTYLWGGTK